MAVEHTAPDWLTELYDYDPPRRGQIRGGVILKLEEQGATVDVGLKRDGFIPRTDLERLEDDMVARLKPNQPVQTCIIKPEDQNGNLILSLYEAQQEEDWIRAQEFLASGELGEGTVTGHNRGGLLVKFGVLQGFLPASHLWTAGGRGLSGAQHQAGLQAYVGQTLPFQIIEAEPARRRLILSERLARQQIRRQNIERLLNELAEGEVRRGIVRRLCDFGAFVDLGGADGLVHRSELAWRKVHHPNQVLQVGQEIEVYILHLDPEQKRIGLSLKRLQPDPWTFVQETYTTDQLVLGVVTNLVNFGAFAVLDLGVEGLVHLSELTDPPPQKPQDVVQTGAELVLRILRIDPFRRRIALSLKDVSEAEREEWLANNH